MPQNNRMPVPAVPPDLSSPRAEDACQHTGTISSFNKLHDGKRLFILSSGPSLAGLDLSLLGRRIVMGLNRSALIYPGTHYHCTMDERIFKEYPEMLKKTRYLFTFPERPFGIPITLLGANGFSSDLENGIYSGYTVSYFALQVAAYMGFKQIFYLGLDLKNQGYRTHFFGHDFQSRTHDQTEYPRMRQAFENAAPLLAQRGIEVFNCSPDSTLECFRKVSFEWAIEQ